jgi:peroxiredoxin
LPQLAKIQSDFADQPFTFLAVEVRNMKDKSKEIMDELNLNFPVLFDEKKMAREKYNLRGTPLTLVLDREGRVFFKHYGYSAGMENTLRDEISELLSYTS